MELKVKKYEIKTNSESLDIIMINVNKHLKTKCICGFVINAKTNKLDMCNHINNKNNNCFYKLCPIKET